MNLALVLLSKGALDQGLTDHCVVGHHIDHFVYAVGAIHLVLVIR